jgi:hypothetical protein
MRFYSLLDCLTPVHSSNRPGWTRHGPAQRQPATAKPQLEQLEDRCLLSFLPPVDYSAGTSPHTVVLADFNGDTRLDIAVANFNGNVSVLLGNADGTFQSAVNSAGSFRSSLAVGHFNADNNLDLVSVNPGVQIRVLGGKGDGTFQPGQTSNLSSGNGSLNKRSISGSTLAPRPMHRLASDRGPQRSWTMSHGSPLTTDRSMRETGVPRR